MSTCNCGKEFEDTHGHGLCFGCKIRGITFTSVDTGPSKFFKEKQEVDQIQSKGYEPIRRSEIGEDRRDAPEKPFDLGDKIKRQIHEQYYATQAS